MRFRMLAIPLLIGVLSTIAQAAENAQEHTVQSGQTLGKIAKRYGVTVDALCAANGLSRTAALQPGKELVIPAPGGEARVHFVAKGETIGKIAERYHVSIEQLLATNRLHRTSMLQEGQKLLLPGAADAVAPQPTEMREPEPPTPPSTRQRQTVEDREPRPGSGPEMLTVGASQVYFYRPVGRGHLGMRPAIVYLHGRGAQPESDCHRWAPIARQWGWLVCPSGPEDRGSGRGWANNWASGHQIVMGAIEALRNRFGRRVQAYGNTLIGFSEGAYVAMNVGVREPRVFNRWLILAAKTNYWGGPGLEALGEARHRLKRVFLITGVDDEVIDGTEDTLRRLREAHVATRIAVPEDMGHEVPLERKAGLYREALLWLAEGKGPRAERAATRSSRTALR